MVPEVSLFANQLDASQETIGSFIVPLADAQDRRIIFL